MQAVLQQVKQVQTAAAGEDWALSVEALSAGYPGDRYAVENVSFRVRAGERVAMIGPNGAGKSTLFKAMVGLIPFTHGEISIFGRDCHDSHSLVGYVPQHEAIDWTFPVTVRDVVMMGRARQIGWFRWPGRQDRQTVDDLLERLHLGAIADRQIGQLSGGQRRRVFIARALAQETQVLLMDEPFTGVDSAAEQEIMQTLDLLTAQGITLVVATHDMSKAAQDFDRMLLVNRTVLAHGTAQEVMQPEMLRQAYGGAVRVFESDGEMFMVADEHGCGH